MIYHVSFQSKRDAHDVHSAFKKSLFVESNFKPDSSEIHKLVAKYTGGDFAAETIEFVERPDLNADELKKQIAVSTLN